MNDVAVVIGAADCVREDLVELERQLYATETTSEIGRTTFAVNDGGAIYSGRLDHWCTLHAEELAERMRRRSAAGYPGGFTTWDCDAQGAERQLPWAHRLQGCTSGFMAVAVAHYLGHRKIILCGIPIERRPYAIPHIHHGTGEWPLAERVQNRIKREAERRDWLRSSVRSMSGWTAEFFGRPTADWLVE